MQSNEGSSEIMQYDMIPNLLRFPFRKDEFSLYYFDIEIYQKNKNKLATAVAKGIATGFNLKYISDKNSPHSTDVSEKAKDAIDWCSKYNILPPDIISDMDDQKILLCIGLYNTVKFLAEHI